MKKFLLFFALLSGTAVSVNAQSWFQNNPHWTSYFSFGFAGTGYENVAVQGDTMLQGLVATKLQRCQYTSSTDVTDIRVARQQGDTIWVWNAITNQFNLAYNFSLAVGDSVAVPLYWNSEQFKYTIDAVGMLLIEGQSRRFQRIDFIPANANGAHCQALIIETIGFVNGICADSYLYGGHLFIDERNEGFVDGPEWAFCEYRNDDITYSDPITLCAGLTSQTEPIIETSFSIQPNPFHESFSVATKKDQTASYLRVFDANGRLVLQTSPPFSHISTHTLTAGLYFLEITSKTGNRQFCKAIKE